MTIVCKELKLYCIKLDGQFHQSKRYSIICTFIIYLAELPVYEEMCGGCTYHTHAEGMGSEDSPYDTRKTEGHPSTKRMHKGTV